MRRNYVTDCVLLVLSIMLAVTGAMLWQHPAARRGILRGRRPACTKPRMVHRCASLAFLLAMMVHLIWHREWIEENTVKVAHGED